MSSRCWLCFVELLARFILHYHLLGHSLESWQETSLLTSILASISHSQTSFGGYFCTFSCLKVPLPHLFVHSDTFCHSHWQSPVNITWADYLERLNIWWLILSEIMAIFSSYRYLYNIWAHMFFCIRIQSCPCRNYFWGCSWEVFFPRWIQTRHNRPHPGIFSGIHSHS